MYDEKIPGINRKAYIYDDQKSYDEKFVDERFKIPYSDSYTLVRLYDLIEE